MESCKNAILSQRIFTLIFIHFFHRKKYKSLVAVGKIYPTASRHLWVFPKDLVPNELRMRTPDSGLIIVSTHTALITYQRKN